MAELLLHTEDEVSLMSEAYFASPYGIYQRLRAQTPVYWSAETERWWLLRYDDVSQALRGSGFTSRFAKPGLFRHWFTYMEGDEHARLRKLISPHFVTGSVRQMRDRIAAITERLLREAMDKRTLDFMADFANLLPVELITGVLGLPLEDGPLLVQWTTDITAAKGLATVPEMKFRSVASFQAMIAYLRDFVADFAAAAYPQHPVTGLLEALKRRVISEDELLSTLMLLVLATIETTSSLLSNGLLALLQHPEQSAKLVADPTLLKNAVEEMLRYDAPAQFINRIARDDMEIRGVRIQAGHNILAVIGAANHDPAVFPDPDCFDVERPNALKHLAFGGGAHHCPGAPLARETALIVFEKLLPVLHRIHLRQPVQVYQQLTLMFRRLESLPIIFLS